MNDLFHLDDSAVYLLAYLSLLSSSLLLVRFKKTQMMPVHSNVVRRKSASQERIMQSCPGRDKQVFGK